MHDKRRVRVDQMNVHGPRLRSGWRSYRRWLVALALAVPLLLTRPLWPVLWQFAQDPAQVEAAVKRLGWFGPLALIFLNALQIVIAPIPGYVVQLAAGFLYGPAWGSLWGALGLMAGASAAFWLARLYGRPLAEKLVGRGRLDKWDNVTHSASVAVWVIMLLGPTGDIPYFLAGLSRVGFGKIIVITAVLRIPSAIVAASAGAGVMLLSWTQLAVLVAVLSAIVVAFLRYQQPLVLWFDRRVRREVDREISLDETNLDADPEMGPAVKQELL